MPNAGLLPEVGIGYSLKKPEQCCQMRASAPTLAPLMRLNPAVIHRLAVAALVACSASSLASCGGVARPAAALISSSPSAASSPEPTPSQHPQPLLKSTPRATVRPPSLKPIKPAPPECPSLVMKSFSAQPLGYRQATLSWSSSGGCAPFRGYIAGYMSITGASWRHPISSASGSVADSISALGIGCSSYQGLRTVGVTYNLWLNAGNGQLVGAGPSTRLVNVQVC
jgi:hypothetical protein